MVEYAPLVDVLVAEMEKRFTDGDYPVGTKLPSEAHLASELGVSRPLIREMLARLRERGYIETLNGRGSFVRPRTPAPMLDLMLKNIQTGGPATYTPDDLYAVRSMVEVETARIAATTADDEELQELSDLVQSMAAAEDDPESYTVGDANFHLTIARATHNPLFAALLSPIIDVVVSGIYDSVSTFREGMRGGNQGHRKILNALLARDPDAAASAMAEHMAYSRSTFPEGAFRQGKLSAESEHVARTP